MKFVTVPNKETDVPRPHWDSKILGPLTFPYSHYIFKLTGIAATAHSILTCPLQHYFFNNRIELYYSGFCQS